MDATRHSKPLIAILAGGYSAETAISLESGRMALNSFQGGAFDAVLVLVGEEGWYAEPDRVPVDLSDFSMIRNGIRQRFDGAFVALHGRPGENGEINGYLDMLSIPHSTCSVRAAVLTFDKALCKQSVAGTGVQLAKSVLIREGDTTQPESFDQLHFPLFVKPNQNGSSCGISKVHNRSELDKALRNGWAYDRELLLEEGVEGGTEVTCAVYRIGGQLRTLPICEIVSGKGHDFFDYKAKYTAGESEEIVPARISEEDAESVRQCSRAIYDKLDLKGLVRIDYILRDGKCWFLEVNTVPGMSEASIVPKMIRATGQTFSGFFEAILQEAMHQKSLREPSVPHV